jgi:hypothetical protein
MNCEQSWAQRAQQQMSDAYKAQQRRHVWSPESDNRLRSESRQIIAQARERLALSTTLITKSHGKRCAQRTAFLRRSCSPHMQPQRWEPL